MHVGQTLWPLGHAASESSAGDRFFLQIHGFLGKKETPHSAGATESKDGVAGGCSSNATPPWELAWYLWPTAGHQGLFSNSPVFVFQMVIRLQAPRLQNFLGCQTPGSGSNILHLWAVGRFASSLAFFWPSPPSRDCPPLPPYLRGLGRGERVLPSG